VFYHSTIEDFELIYTGGMIEFKNHGQMWWPTLACNLSAQDTETGEL
jgi:hypothetical protein